MIEDGLGPVIAEYNAGKSKASRRTKSNTKTKSKKQSGSKRSSTTKSRAKTPDSSSRGRGSRSKAADIKGILAADDDDDDDDDEEEDPVAVFSATSSSTSAATMSSLFSSFYFYWWAPFLVLSAVVLYTHCEKGNDCDAPSASSMWWNITIHNMASSLAPLVAFSGIAWHPSKKKPLANMTAVGIIWYVASVVLPMCIVEGEQRLLRWLTIGASAASSVFFALSFLSKQEELTSSPTLDFVRSVPFAIVGYYLLSELFHEERGVLFSAYSTKQLESDPVIFVFLLLKVVAPLFAGWAAASRVGYGGIGWRSQQATKQILGVVGTLLLLFSFLVEFEGQVLLPLDQVVASGPLLRYRTKFVCDTLAIGLFATSALMHMID